ncbi:MAG: nucleotidyltransferase family protein [Gammaproteobacteria bacterium]
MNKIDLKPHELKVVLKILQNHVPSYSVHAFGSRVTGKAKKFSDLDLVIMTKTPLDALVMYHINHAFEQSDLPFKVDIVDSASISDEFKKIIELTSRELKQ